MTTETKQAISYDEAWRLASTATWAFESYYKYKFTFGAQVDGFTLKASAGGDADGIYRYVVTTGAATWTDVLGAGECWFRIVNAAGVVQWDGMPL